MATLLCISQQFCLMSGRHVPHLEEVALKLHQRGLDLLLNVQDAMNHVERLREKDVRDLLSETEFVLRELLARDVPTEKVDQ